ncbi:ABC transporter permease [Ammonifex thiophilus]|uniref:ABC transporter permease n=1 Tax=Ammonifex thiophilus TaxID=444093 RepID=A0A3D8P2C4_9THEO|nr:ABC transporter permease [Ammonifex thiophilus]RDV80948.1 ABC transporter permease [Ammonifex thiophilus]
MRVPGRRASFFWPPLSLAGNVSLFFLLFLVAVGILAPWISRYSPHAVSGPPLAPPDWEHWLGTDELGVDLWAQMCYGARVSLLVGFGVALLAGLGGGAIGALAGYTGGLLDRLLLRLIDIALVVPQLPLLILLATFLGARLENVILALALFSWPRPARIVRSQVLVLKRQTYLVAARSFGARTGYLLRRHLLPELAPVILVSLLRLAARGIVAEAGLSFIGLGDPTLKSWGKILYHATNFKGLFFTPYWKWWLVAPWLALTLLLLAITFLGRDLERIADPRLRVGGARV